MIIRNSLTSIIRTKKKTALFFLLILLLCVFMGMGVSVWASNQAMMAECEENYSTIGVISYMGAGYPDETYLSETTAQALGSISREQVEGAGGVLHYQPVRKSLGYIENFQPSGMSSDYSRECILVLKDCYKTQAFNSDFRETIGYTATVARCVYTYRMKNKVLVNFAADEEEFQPDKTKLYLAYGYWQGEVLCLREIVEIENMDFLEDPQNEVVKRAEFYHVANSMIQVQMVERPEELYAFHQGQTTLTEGAFYRADVPETDGKRLNVCLVTEDIASGMGLTVGDTLPLTLIPVKAGNIYDSYVPGETYLTDSYKITGIMKSSPEFKHTVYIPPREDVAGADGYEVGQGLLKNGTGDRFAADMEPYLSDRMMVDVYDQGYTQIMDSMRSLHQTTLIILAICTAATLAVLVLFGYLFVYKQRDTVIIMKYLGTETGKIYTYLMVSCGAIALTAALAGACIGYGASSYVMSRVMAFLESGIGTGVDTRYSYLSEELMKEYGYHIQVGIGYFLMTALLMTLAAILICLAFSFKSLRPPRVKRKKERHVPKREGKSSDLNGVVFRYGWLSARRGGMRTFIVFLVSGVLMLVFCVLSYTGDHYQQQKQQVQENTVIKGYFASVNGKRISRLAVDEKYVTQLEESGYIENVYRTSYRELYHYFFLGISQYADGRKGTVKYIEMPTGEFSQEKLLDEERRKPCLLFTDDISAVAEFFFSEHYNITYAEGYDSSMFSVNRHENDEEQPRPCLVSEATMKKNGISLGDEICVGIYHGTVPKKLVVAGYYSGEDSMEHILVPHGRDDEDWTTVVTTVVMSIGYNSYEEIVQLDTVRFNLKDARQLTEFKDYLAEEGFSQVGERNDIMNAIVLWDTQYQKTIQQLDEKIKYMNLLYPVLYVLTGFISFLVSYLMMHNRKGELALMQSMGTPRRKIFFAFFLEQAALCLGGIILVWLIWGIFTGFSATQALCMAVCIVCYLAGCALSIGILNSSKVLELLRDKE